MENVIIKTTTRGMIERLFWSVILVLISFVSLIYSKGFVQDPDSIWSEGEINAVIFCWKWISIACIVYFAYRFFTDLFFGHTRVSVISKRKAVSDNDRDNYNTASKWKSWFSNGSSSDTTHQFSQCEVHQNIFGTMTGTGTVTVHLQRYRQFESEDVYLTCIGVADPHKIKEEIEEFMPWGSVGASIN